MDKIRKILMPTDFSEESVHALRYGLDLAKTLKASVRILHVVDMGAFLAYGAENYWTTPGVIDDIKKVASKQMKELLKTFQGEVEVDGVVDTHAVSVVDEICADATKHSADLIVMSTHGRKGVPRFFLGSVAERIVRMAPCPVLTVRGKVEV